MSVTTCTATTVAMFPQADRLDKVATTIDAVEAGACTAAAVAIALDVVERQGAYYTSAAESLGLLSRCATTPLTWECSAAGTALAAASGSARAAVLAALVADLPAVDVFLAGGADSVAEMICDAGLAPDTATRRAQTVSAWVDYITDPTRFGADVDTQMADCATRVAAAALAATTALKAAASVAARAAQARFCERCFLQIPSGLTDCPDC